MSLFKTREFWQTSSEDDEYFDQNSLLVTKLNSDYDYIVTGSQSGVLRIFKPTCEVSENNNLRGYEATDLLVEKLLENPILQIGCGRLVSGSTNQQLAVLHARKVSIYNLVIKDGATDHGNQYNLQMTYEHRLQRSAYNFIVGPFGETQNRDFICIQSLDGQMTIFEQESFSFSCFLPDLLLPGPIAYARKSDSIVTSNGSWCIESYKYKHMSEVGHLHAERNEENSCLESDWSYDLGEAVIDISVIDDFINKETWIMVLGERNLYSINDSGKTKFIKRLEYSPICFSTYVLNDKIISMVVSETSTLMIYQNTSLKWSAQLQFLPIAIRRAFLKTIRGVLVLLSEEGLLQCCYLGTEPRLFVAPPLGVQELDFEKAEVELATLNKIIKNSYANDTKITSATAERELSIKVTVSPHLEPCTFEDHLNNTLNNQMCTISIDILPQALFEELQITVFVQRPLKVIPQTEFYSNLSERTLMKCQAFLYEASEIPTLNVQVIASFISNLGVPRTITKSAMLPLNLVLETCQPQKESEHKITLNINQVPSSLSTLFPEFMGENSLTQTSNAIGFQNLTGEGKPVSILLAKSSERYRLQSDSFASLNLLIEQMAYRLNRNFSNNGSFQLSYNSSLPCKELIRYIEDHFNKRLEIMQLQNELTQLTAQFRIVQKRLIAKFKVKNPTSLANMEILLEDTYTEIISVTENLEIKIRELEKCNNELSCAVHIIVNLVNFLHINKDIVELMHSAFCRNIFDLEGQNWEDVLDGSLCFLLRTILAKSDKDKLRAAHTSFEEIKDVSKIEKHITQVLERIQKKEPDYEKQLSIEDVKPVEPTETPEEDNVPIGSKFGESSSRLLSARKSLLRRRKMGEDQK